MVIDQERTQFEAAMWTYYLDLKAKGWSAPGEGDQTPEALFWREESGKYGVLSVEAAWNGWQMARKSEVPAPGARDQASLIADAQDAFDAQYPLPSNCTRFTGGYASTGYSAWMAHDHCKKWEGWKAAWLLLAATPPQTAPVAQLSEPPKLAFDESHIDYIDRYGGFCRDCADEDGVCPSSGLPCGGSKKAIRHVLTALAYGVNHGYIPVILCAAPTTPKELT